MRETKEKMSKRLNIQALGEKDELGQSGFKTGKNRKARITFMEEGGFAEYDCYLWIMETFQTDRRLSTMEQMWERLKTFSEFPL